MPDEILEPAPESARSGDSQRSQLIESIYRIALEPETYDVFIGRWDEFILERMKELGTLRAEDRGLETPEIATHFEIAERLLEQGRKAGQAQPLSDSAGSRPARSGVNPQFLIDSTGAIVWTNAAAMRLFGLKRMARLDDLDISARQDTALRSRLESLASTTDPEEPPLILRLTVVTAAEGLAPGDVVHLVANRLSQKIGADLLLVEPLVAKWPSGMARLLADTYGLSHAEAEIAEFLSPAQKPAYIAEARSSSLATVRTQIKSMLVKTGVKSLTELVRLLHLLMRFAEDHGAQYAAIPIAQGEMRSLQLKSGVMLPVELHGPATGRPVIFLHGMLDGASLTQAMREALARRNFRFICPTRAWFGEAQPDHGPIEGAPDRIAQQVREACGMLGIKQAVVLGHMAGSVYAFATAKAAPGLVRGIVCVAGGVPIVSKTQFAAMSHRQRVVAYTAAYTNGPGF